MNESKHRVAIIGCGRMGQVYADAYSTYPDTEIVAIAEYDADRRKAVGERYGVSALYPDAEALFTDVVPDVAAVILPVKYIKDAVIAAAEAGVKGVSFRQAARRGAVRRRRDGVGVRVAGRGVRRRQPPARHERGAGGGRLDSRGAVRRDHRRQRARVGRPGLGRRGASTSR